MTQHGLRAVLLAVLLALAAGSAGAQDAIKIGVIAPFSGPFADYGRMMEGGIRAWIARAGDTVAGRKVEVLLRDSTGPVPDLAKRLAQELIVRDKVQFLAGFGLTPNALAAAPLATQAKTPMVIMNAASSVITTKSPYIVRLSMTLAQETAPLAAWAARNGVKRVYTLVADYAPGLDAEAAFGAAFTAAGTGGEIIGSVRVPLRNPEFAPYIQRIKDAAPDAVFVFLPAGEQGVGFMKAFHDRGLAEAGILLLATGDVTDDHVLPAMGEPALGVITSAHYSLAHTSPENQDFVAAFRAANPDAGRPNFMAVAAWDGMAAMYEVARRLNGEIDGDRAMDIFKTLRLTSPRGPIAIDPETRDIVQTIYIRRVEHVDGELYNVEFDQVPDVKDPGK